MRGSRRQNRVARDPSSFLDPWQGLAAPAGAHCFASGAESGCQSLFPGAASLSHSPRTPGQARKSSIILGHSQPEAAFTARNRLEPRSGWGPIEPLALDVVVIASTHPAGSQGAPLVVSFNALLVPTPICLHLAQICGDDRIRPCPSWIGAPASVLNLEVEPAEPGPWAPLVNVGTAGAPRCYLLHIRCPSAASSVTSVRLEVSLRLHLSSSVCFFFLLVFVRS